MRIYGQIVLQARVENEKSLVHAVMECVGCVEDVVIFDPITDRRLVYVICCSHANLPSLVVLSSLPHNVRHIWARP